jgi:hypothetical protein
MIEFLLFALVGIFYWAYRRSKSENDERFAALSKKTHQLDSELKSGNEARWSDVNSRLGALNHELEELQTRGQKGEGKKVSGEKGVGGKKVSGTCEEIKKAWNLHSLIIWALVHWRHAHRP